MPIASQHSWIPNPFENLKKTLIYYALVHPHLSNGLACWNNATKTSIKKITILQNKIVRLIIHNNEWTPASGLYKSLQILTLNNMIKLTLITISHSFHHKTLPKMFDNLFKYLIKIKKVLSDPCSKFSWTQELDIQFKRQSCFYSSRLNLFVSNIFICGWFKKFLIGAVSCVVIFKQIWSLWSWRTLHAV